LSLGECFLKLFDLYLRNGMVFKMSRRGFEKDISILL